MAFVVEDGTGLADATSYTTVQEFVDYWSDRGKASVSPGGTSAPIDVQAWLVLATDYIERVFRRRFIGQPSLATQRLWFPALYAYDAFGNEITGVPEKIKYAVIEYAMRTATSPLLPDPTTDASGQTVASSTIGPMSVSYHAGGAVRTVRAYPAADLLLRDLLTSGSGSAFR